MSRQEAGVRRPPARTTLVFIVPRLARGGMLSVMQVAWRHLRDHRIVVVTQEHSTESVPHETVKLRRAFGDPLRFPGAWIYAWRVARTTAAIARASPGDVILVPQDALASGAGAVVAGRRTGTPVVVMDHGSAIVYRTAFFWRQRVARSHLQERIREPLLRSSLRLLHRITLAGADRVLLPSSEAVERFMSDGVPPERIARYHVPIDLSRFHPPDPEARRTARLRLGVADRLLACYVGRLTPEKGLDVLIDALSRLPAVERPILAVGGRGPAGASIERRAVGLGVDVRMLGEVPPDNLPGLIGAADVVVYASRQGTNVPVAILEAMACGRLIVATDQPPANVELLAGGRGIVVPAGEVEAYAEALRAVVAMNDVERRAVGQAARQWVEARYAADRIAAEFADAFTFGHVQPESA